jgi:adenylate cyclase
MPGLAPARRAVTGVFAAAGLLVGGWVGFGETRGVASLLDRLEMLTLDWRLLLAGPRPAPGDVVIVAIDDETLNEQEDHSLSRALIARIVRALAVLHPLAVALDFAFPDAKEGDPELGQALQTTPSVVAAIGVFDEGRQAAASAGPEFSLTPKPTRILWPTKAIADAAAEIGLANVSTDRGGTPRYAPMLFTIDGGVVPSLALAAVTTATGEDPVVGTDSVGVAGRTIRLDLGYHMPLRFYGPSGSFPRISAADLLAGAIDAKAARDKIVVLGATATGLADLFATPFDRVAPGVEVVATTIGNLMAGDALRRGPATRRIDAATTALMPVAVVGLMALRRAAVGLALAGLVLALWAAAVFALFLKGYWLAVAAPLSVALPLAAAVAAARIVAERAEGRRLAAENSALSKFHSPLLLDHILREPNFLAKPVRLDVAVLFLDLTGSTGVSEALGPERSRDMLKTMQTLVEGVVASERGVVINYMGDGVLAAFGLPAPEADDARRALDAVERLAAYLAVWIAGLPQEAAGRLDFRIGAHFGPAIVSRLGSPTHQQITLAGDTVNAASRLLEVAKERHRRIVVTEDLIAAASAAGLEDFASRGYETATIPIRGRVASLQVHMRS